MQRFDIAMPHKCKTSSRGASHAHRWNADLRLFFEAYVILFKLYLDAVFIFFHLTGWAPKEINYSVRTSGQNSIAPGGSVSADESDTESQEADVSGDTERRQSTCEKTYAILFVIVISYLLCGVSHVQIQCN